MRCSLSFEFFRICRILKIFLQQECIPVGCVPPTCCPYLPACTAPGGMYLVWGPGGTWFRGVPGSRGCTWSLGGVPGPGGVYLVQGSVPGPGGVPGWGMYLVPGGCTWFQGVVPGPGGCTWSGGVPVLGGVPGPGGCAWSLGVPTQVLPLP